MTKIIAVAAVILCLYGGWNLFLYWEKVRDEKFVEEKKAVSSQVVPTQLPGLPAQMEPMLRAAEKGGTEEMGKFLKRYGRSIRDPRLAWIELDYVILLARSNPPEAKKLFAQVKSRTPENSPVYPRIKQLEKTYE